MNRYFLYWLLLLTVCVMAIMCSCGRKNWQNRGLKKGWLDTTTHVNTFEFKPDSAKKDEAIKKVADKIDSALSEKGLNPMDSATKEVIKWVLKREIEKVYIPMVYPDQIITFEDGSQATIGFTKDGKLTGKFIFKSSDAKPIIKEPWYKSREPWYILIILILLFLFWYSRK
jgi:uncharacterized protein (UPF0297 family)